jgi:Raf kinase inhibitor-like YbhB/YbcL family protein
MALQVTSAAFPEGGTIPRKYTCEGENISPPLSWSGAPAGTRSLALVVDDPDAPRGDWVHWVLYGLPPGLAALEEGAPGVGAPGVNDYRRPGYAGPCPPPGPAHRYFFKIYALDAPLDLKAGATKAELERAMKGHILAEGQLVGKYARK